jgi:Met-zincin/Domain of unknown function (DUF5117)
MTHSVISNRLMSRLVLKLLTIAAAFALVTNIARAESDVALLMQSDEPPCSGPDCPGPTTEASAATDKPPPKPKTIEAFVKDKVKIDGLFPIYRDAVSGAVFVEIGAEQLGREFIYYTFVRNGVSGPLAPLGDLRFAGQIGDNFVIRLRHRFNKIDVIRRNLAYTINPQSPLNRASGANAGDSLMASLTIVARDADDKRLIVAANPLLVGTDLLRIGNASPLLAVLGLNPTLSKAKTAILDIRNYPANTSIVTEYVFDFKSGPQPVSVELQHNFVETPAAGFETRGYDPRVGLISVRKTNLDRIEGSPIDDVIQRWRLQKLDPSAPLSPPLKPIIFWIQNSTPLEYRETVKQAVLTWNHAFEAAGFKNAVEVREQPDEPNWDAGDIRYNLIQWIASPSPLFNGYGPSVIDPRTGEIIAANIILEHGSLRSQQLLQQILPGDPASPMSNRVTTNVASPSRVKAEFAVIDAAAEATQEEASTVVADRLLRQRLTYLVMHEVGHTLGLTHNMKGSVYRSVDDLRGKLSPEEPITGSVMDYPAANLLGLDTPNGQVFPTILGPYDYWAIQFAYDPSMASKAQREALLSRAGQPGYRFGIDSEDARTTGRGIDPRVIPFDMSNEPLTFAELQMRLIRDVQRKLPHTLGRTAGGLDRFVETDALLMSLYSQQIETVSRYVGGVYDERDRFASGTTNGPALEPIPAATQTRAIAILNEMLFAPGTLAFSPDYLKNLVQARRGQSSVDLANHLDDVLRLQLRVFDHVLHPDTLERVANLAAVDAGWTVDSMLDRITAAVFDADLKGSVSSQRRLLQESYTGLLLRIFTANAADMSAFRAPILRQIDAVERRMRGHLTIGDVSTLGSRALIRQDIRHALEFTRSR